jgi:hypothetical protein
MIMSDNPFNPFNGEDPFKGINPLPEAVQQSLNETFAKQLRDQFMVKVAMEYGQAMRACMEEEGVNLNAAIQMVMDLMSEDAKLDPDPERDEMVQEALTLAARMLRKAMSEAYEMVRLDTSGAREPKPYDQKQHLEQRARELDNERLASQLSGLFGKPDGSES